MKTLTAYYDLAIGPVSFDVLGFLVQARMAQQRLGADALHVVIVPKAGGVGGLFRDKTALYDAAEMEWRLWNIVIPACRLVKATVTLAQDWEHAERINSGIVWPPDWRRQTLGAAHHHAREVIAAARAGERIPRLTASFHALRMVQVWFASMGRPVVTLTRRATYDDARNSNAAAWDALAAHADEHGFAVVDIQDTAQALRHGSGYAELSLDLRMACYQMAAMNWHANGGPSALCWYSHAPFVHVAAAWPPQDWARHYAWLGLEVGQQLPWARDDQILLYEPDSPQNLPASFDAWLDHRNTAQAA